MRTKKKSSRDIQSPSESPQFLIVLGESVEIANIGVLQQQLEDALKVEQSTLLLDAGQVSRIDAAALQLLAVFYREARVQGYSVRWQNPSAAMSRAAAWIGLADWLELGQQPLQQPLTAA